MTTATASTVRATGLYRRLQNESRANAADPIELVTMLYDELETAVGVLAAMVRQGQRVSATEPAHRARAILIGLDVGLDHENGGDVAEALARVYRSMRRKLDNAVAANDAEELDELLKGIVTVSSAWRQLRQ
ncbi:MULTISPECIES: flagellar protein FliS [unclassified Sphingopyxis]|jgi:flagellar protein FliS|uniref:flagellar export chaperone FliS n=1 Tax=unclassified Sphingopyxis TaxID=2614943 RepID=UPI00073076F6|nr:MULTISPECIES: flagellar protein FliS [unclassified Sphingopyxis]KTE20370.1 flagellar protein FliS [Sphingopyxis sp. H057]KTE49019.1 flagellar protein FliS [Sphingopyxis sp. H073]KTE53333.1 flagellar protein FliS [Sphingopyxis sp. H071]KTE57949.1 flagellar protein FliS [Sphingopyxis sp. H107]KTE61696.1 flagellar protein FliS [Sphingopyxis sp. H100]